MNVRPVSHAIRVALLGLAVPDSAQFAVWHWRRFGVLVLAVLASACCPERVVTRPVVVETERLVVQPIPADLLREHPIAAGSVSQCPFVAAARKAELLACNADKAAIRAMLKSD